MGLIPNDIKTAHFAQLADLSGDGNLDLLMQLSGYPDKVYDMLSEPFTEIQDAIGLIKTAVVLDAAVADLDGDLDNDLFMVRGERNEGLVQIDEYTLEARFRSSGVEQGFSFVTSGDVSIEVYPLWVWSVDQIFIGSDGFHPEENFFTLLPVDTTVWGIYDHVPGVDTGLYIGYDPATQLWQILRSSGVTNLVVVSTMTITEPTAIGWDPDEPPRTDQFQVNLGNTFENRTESAGFLVPSSGRNVVAADFDNDMDQDLYIVSTGPVENWPNLLYENDGSGHFNLVPDAAGAAGNNLGRGDAVTVVDYNGDGFLDMLVTNGTSKTPFDADGPTQLYKNLGNDNHWLEIDLEGVFSNRDGIGVQLHATAGGVVQLREQGGGMHYRGQNHQRVHFGLGSNIMVDVLTVRWPGGNVQEILDIAADQIIHVIEPAETDVPEQDDTLAVVLLIGCYPNPFNPSTVIAFRLDQSRPVKLSIHDASGRLVRTLVDGEIFPAGISELVWAGRDNAGRQVSSGVYFYSLQAAEVNETKRMVLMK